MMSAPAAPRARSARGAILIHVGIAILVLTGLSAFVLDYGVLWLSRAQAQNAADAGALAGATALAFDDQVNVQGYADLNARSAAQTNTVLGDVAATTVNSRFVTTPPICALSKPNCVQVTVYRDNGHGNPLPVYFAPIFGVTSQGIQATATAQAANANFSSCLKPWLIPDKWVENIAPANQFNPGDFYTPPNPISSGTGWSTTDTGTTLTLAQGDPAAQMDGNDYYEIGDASNYSNAIAGCVTQLGIGDAVAVTTVTGILPERRALTFAAVSPLIANGPAIVPVALFSPVEYAAAGPTGGPSLLHIVHIMGFRISGVDADGTLHGTIVTALGEIRPGPVLESALGLLKFIMLVR
jgi:Flp pilus assembly protein TadG